MGKERDVVRAMGVLLASAAFCLFHYGNFYVGFLFVCL